MKNKQAGFSVIEGILLVAILGAVCGVGWIVIRANNAADNSFGNAEGASSSSVKQVNESAQAESTKVDNIQSSNGIMKISELGIQFTVPSELSDLIYVTEKQIDNRGKEVVYARLSSTSLMELSSLCTPDFSALGVIAKGLGEMPTGETTSERYYGSLVATTSTAFYTFEQSHASCAENDKIFEAVDTKVSELTTALESSLKTITEISN